MRECPYAKNANVAERCEMEECECGRVLKKENAEHENTEVAQGLVFHGPTNSLLIESCTINGFSGSLLRDTGCTTAGVRKSYVNEQQYTGRVQKCRTFGGKIESFPLAKVQVNTPYFDGEIEACVINNPVTDLILGNVPGIQTTHGGKVGSIICEPSAMVTTRAQAKAAESSVKPIRVPKIERLEIQPDKLKQLQKEDHSLKTYFQQVNNDASLEKQGHCFVLKNDILTRVFQDKTEKVYQIVVPQTLTETVLKVAHDLPMSGHFGVRRTLQRVLMYFYWPTVKRDVVAYCKSCDTCQRTLPRGRVPCAPLEPMPLISEPFQRIAIDIVGPILPSSSSGHKYILTIVDVATRYPEAVPLRKIDTITVAEALFSVFCRMGCPKEILSDCGTQFVSELMTEIHRLLSIKPVTTTPYHPQSNGLVERFNGTLKTMLRRTVQDQPRDWDRMIPAVLFAYRELPNSSTGFSPFELMFGRPARGPTYLLAQTWSSQDISQEDRTLYQYVFDLKNRLESTCTLAKQQVLQSSKKYKTYADKKAKVRTFTTGHKVLVLLSDDKNKLQTKWKGPYIVLEQTNPVDYKIDMDGITKIFHVNMLKEYFDRADKNQIMVNASVSKSVAGTESVPWNDIISETYFSENTVKVFDVDCKIFVANKANVKPACVGIVSEQDNDDSVLPTIPSIKGETYKDVHISDELDSLTIRKVEEVLAEFSDILTDKPGKAVGVEPHSIALSDDTPIRKKPYPLPFSTRQVVEKEVKAMLDLGVIEPSTSAFSSPVVLVTKPDGSIRFCIDYRALNAKTIFDSEPIPDMEELFCQLSEAQYFIKIDLTKGYWQILVKESDKHKTAFQTPLGLFQWTRMPFGLQNAPATFARVMRQLQLQKHSAISFFDDILIYISDVTDMLNTLTQVLQKLRKFGLCVRPTKMFVGFTKLDFLGHRLEQGHLMPQTEKVKKIIDSKTPQTKRQVRALLGLMSYYRRYIPEFAEITNPLTDLTKGSAPRIVKWSSACEAAVNQVQNVLLTKPVLLLPDLKKAFVLRTDASATGMGGVLLQESKDLYHPVKYISKKFSDAQLRYSTIERECLAIVWALTKLARFLLGREFILQTDHRPLTFLKEAKTKNNRLLRWALVIQEFHFTVQPISGKANILADMLSRL